MKKLIRVVKVTPIGGYEVEIVFEDGKKKNVNLKSFLHGPIFEPILQDEVIFRAIKVIDGTIGWDNGADIDPDVLYYDLKPAWMEEKVDN